MLNVNGVVEMFYTVHACDNVPAIKPSPSGIILCCNELRVCLNIVLGSAFDFIIVYFTPCNHGQVSPAHAIFVGDSPSDARAARAAGCRSIGVLWGSYSRQELEPYFDILVTNLHQLEQQFQLMDCDVCPIHISVDFSPPTSPLLPGYRRKYQNTCGPIAEYCNNVPQHVASSTNPPLFVLQPAPVSRGF